MTEPKFYIRRNGRITGPFAPARLQEFHAQGRLSAADQLSQDKIAWCSALSYLMPEPVTLRPLPQPNGANDAAQLIPQSPETLQIVSEEPEHTPFSRVLGDVLALSWNSSDYLFRIVERHGRRGIFCSLFCSLVLAVAASLFAFGLFSDLFSRFGAGGVLAAATAPIAVGALLYLALVLSRIFWGPRGETGNPGAEVIGGAAMLLSFSAANLAATAVAGLGLPLMATWIGGAFFWGMASANAAMAIRIVLVHYSELKPREAIWISGLILWKIWCLYWIIFSFTAKIGA